MLKKVQIGGVFCKMEKCGMNSLIEILLPHVSSLSLSQLLKMLCAVVAGFFELLMAYFNRWVVSMLLCCCLKLHRPVVSLCICSKLWARFAALLSDRLVWKWFKQWPSSPLTCVHRQTTDVTVVPWGTSTMCITVLPLDSDFGVVQGSGWYMWLGQHQNPLPVVARRSKCHL